MYLHCHYKKCKRRKTECKIRESKSEQRHKHMALNTALIKKAKVNSELTWGHR
jgi:hypothetical protein